MKLKTLVAALVFLAAPVAWAQYAAPMNGVAVRIDGGAPTGIGVASIDCASNASSIATCLGGPIVDSGTLVLNFSTQSPHLFLLGPSSGSAATPTFRTLVPDDYRDNLLPSQICSTQGELDVASTTTETVIYDCLVKNGVMGTTSGIVTEVAGDFKRNHATTDVFTINIKGCLTSDPVACTGGQTFYSSDTNASGAATFSSSAPYNLRFMIKALTSSSQFLLGTMIYGNVTLVNPSGSANGSIAYDGAILGGMTKSATAFHNYFVSSTFDMAQDWHLLVSVIPNFSSAGLVWRRYGGWTTSWP